MICPVMVVIIVPTVTGIPIIIAIVTIPIVIVIPIPVVVIVTIPVISIVMVPLIIVLMLCFVGQILGHFGL